MAGRLQSPISWARRYMQAVNLQNLGLAAHVMLAQGLKQEEVLLLAQGIQGGLTDDNGAF